MRSKPATGSTVSAVECVICTAHSTYAAIPKLENGPSILKVELLAVFCLTDFLRP